MIYAKLIHRCEGLDRIMLLCTYLKVLIVISCKYYGFSLSSIFGYVFFVFVNVQD